MKDKEIKDIGLLKYCHNAYTGKVKICIFEETYEVDIRFRVYGEGEEGLTKDMITAAKNVLNVLRKNREKIQETIKTYYDAEVQELAEEDRCDYFIFNNTNQLKNVIDPKELYIVDLERSGSIKDIKVGLFFECNWDDEGFGIRFDGNGIVIRMGSGAIIY